MPHSWPRTGGGARRCGVGIEAGFGEGGDQGVKRLVVERGIGVEGVYGGAELGGKARGGRRGVRVAGSGDGSGRQGKCGAREGDMAKLREQGAQIAAGGAIGEAVAGVAAGEGVEDFINGEGELGGMERAQGAAEGAPFFEGGEGVARLRRAGEDGRGTVVAAEIEMAEGGAAALAAVGEDEAAFWSHGSSWTGSW